MRDKSCLALSQRPSSWPEGFSLEVYNLPGGRTQSIGEGICFRICKIARGSNSIEQQSLGSKEGHGRHKELPGNVATRRAEAFVQLPFRAAIPSDCLENPRGTHDFCRNV